MGKKPKEPKDVTGPALRSVEPSVDGKASSAAPLVPMPVEGPVDREEIRRKLIARFPKTLAYLAK